MPAAMRKTGPAIREHAKPSTYEARQMSPPLARGLHHHDIMEKVADLATIGFDAVHPVQFLVPRVALQPEKRLVLAMLEDAMATVQRAEPRYGQRRDRIEAHRWIFSDDVTWPFSFLNVCDMLAIDPAYVRRRLAEQWSPASVGRSPRNRSRPMSGSRTRVMAIRADMDGTRLASRTS
jgi:hypothetical protein